MQAYLKSITRTLPLQWKSPCNKEMLDNAFSPDVWEQNPFCPNRQEAEERAEREKDHWFGHLFKSEIMLNYFDLELSWKSAWSSRRVKFVDSREYRIALASTSRAMKHLQIKGYIEIERCSILDRHMMLKLTQKGTEEAAKLLSANSREETATINT